MAVQSNSKLRTVTTANAVLLALILVGPMLALMVGRPASGADAATARSPSKTPKQTRTVASVQSGSTAVKEHTDSNSAAVPAPAPDTDAAELREAIANLSVAKLPQLEAKVRAFVRKPLTAALAALRQAQQQRDIVRTTAIYGHVQQIVALVNDVQKLARQDLTGRESLFAGLRTQLAKVVEKLIETLAEPPAEVSSDWTLEEVFDQPLVAQSSSLPAAPVDDFLEPPTTVVPRDPAASPYIPNQP